MKILKLILPIFTFFNVATRKFKAIYVVHIFLLDSASLTSFLELGICAPHVKLMPYPGSACRVLKFFF